MRKRAAYQLGQELRSGEDFEEYSNSYEYQVALAQLRRLARYEDTGSESYRIPGDRELADVLIESFRAGWSGEEKPE